MSYEQTPATGYKAMLRDIKRRDAHYQKTGEDVRVSSMPAEQFESWHRGYLDPVREQLSAAEARKLRKIDRWMR